MSNDFHTPIASGAAGTSTVVNAPLGQLDAKLGVAHDADGTLKAGAVDVAAVLASDVVTTAKILDANVTTAKLASDAVTTVKITDANVTAAKLATDAVTTAKIAAAAVSAAKIDTAAITQPNLVWDAFNTHTDPRYEWGDKARWHQPAALSLITDAANPFGSKTLRFLGASASANTGKKIWFDDAGLQTGDTITASVMALAASGTWGLSIGWYLADGTEVGTATAGSNLTFSGSARTMTVTSGAAPATAVYALLYIRRTAGTANLDVYAMWANKGSYTGTMPNPGLTDTYTRRGENIVWDSFNRTTDPLVPFGAFGAWHQPAALQIVEGVAANPYGGRTLRFLGASVSTVAGKRIPLKDAGLQVDDTVSFAAIVNSAGPGSWSLRCVFQDATRTNVGSTYSGTTTAVTSVTQLKTPAATVPATATSVLVYMSRPSGSSDLDIYALWGAKNGMVTAQPAPSALPLNVYQDVAEVRPHIAETGLCYLQDWRGIIAKVQNSVSGAQGVIALLGDSWVERKSISTYLRQSLQTTYGDAGPGFVDFYSTDQNSAYNDGWTLVKTGTWTGTDSGATAKGVALSHMTSTDTATPAKFTLTSTGSINEFHLHYYKVVGGGDFRWRVDGGAWTTVSTDAAAAHATVAITGLSTATHILEAEVTVAGSQGVTLIGADLRKTGLGVRVHKAGNGSTKISEWVGVDATLWQAGLTALAPNLCVVILGTNDKTANVVPDTYATNLTTLVSRIRTAMPLCDVLLLSPSDTGDTSTYAMQAYDAAMRATAVANSCAHVSGYMHLGLNANAISRALMDPLATGNSRHLTDEGGRVFANLLLHALRVN